MIQKKENCQYCGVKMESITAKKKFCSDKCRVYFSRQPKVKDFYSKAELSSKMADMPKLIQDVANNKNEPKKGTLAWFLKNS
jgi:hypothetical protein